MATIISSIAIARNLALRAYQSFAIGSNEPTTAALLGAHLSSDFQLLRNNVGRDLTPQEFIDATNEWVENDREFRIGNTRETMQLLVNLPTPMMALAYAATGNPGFAQEVFTLLETRLLGQEATGDDSVAPPPPPGTSAIALLLDHGDSEEDIARSLWVDLKHNTTISTYARIGFGYLQGVASEAQPGQEGSSASGRTSLAN